MKAKIHVGISGYGREVFCSHITPTHSTHGKKFAAVIGPFRTLRGAQFMVNHGRGNPHVRCVADAERLGKLHQKGN